METEVHDERVYEYLQTFPSTDKFNEMICNKHKSRESLSISDFIQAIDDRHLDEQCQFPKGDTNMLQQVMVNRVLQTTYRSPAKVSQDHFNFSQQLTASTFSLSRSDPKHKQHLALEQSVKLVLYAANQESQAETLSE